MTVTVAYSPLTYNCNGSTTAFSVTWPFFLSSDLVVTHITSGGVETVLALTTDYTVSGGRDSTTGLPAVGTVTTLSTYASGVKIRITRSTPRTQSTSFTTAGAFPAKTVEAMIDRVHMIAEEGTGGGQDGVTGDVMQLNSSGAQDYWDGEGSPVRIPFVEFSEDDAPDTPSNGYGRLYVKTDGSLNFKNDDGTETDLTTAAADAEASATAAASSAAAAATAETNAETAEANAEAAQTAAAASAVAAAASAVTAAGALGTKADLVHTHAIADSTGLQAALDAKTSNAHETGVQLIYSSATQIKLQRFGGSSLYIGGTSRPITSSGETASNSGLSASTLYYVYAYWTGSAVALELTTTTPLLYTDGIYVKNAGGGQNYTLVGTAATDSSSQFVETFPTSYGVRSFLNPVRRLRVEQSLFGPLPGSGYTVPDGTGNGSYAFLTGTTANTMAGWILPGTAAITYANCRVIMGGSSTANKVRLVHYDNGPANITQIASFSCNGSGSPENLASQVHSTLSSLQDLTVPKNIAFQVDKLDSSTMTIYKVALEVEYTIG